MKKKAVQEIRRLPDSELSVMQIVWGMEPPVKRADIESEMNRIHPVAQTTVLTLLTRLAEKGFVKIEKQGRGSVYTPLVKREDYLAGQGRRFLDKICGGSISTLAAALVDSGISKEELAELRRLLREDG